jgi:hypothetical protein
MSIGAHLIKSGVVGPKYDVFWQSADSAIAGASPKPVLVITTATDANSAQLQKMMDVCKLQAEQYNVLPLQDGEQIAWHQLRDALQPKFVFLIGITPDRLGISALFRINEPNHFNGCLWLPTLSLTELNQHDPLKKQLWEEGMKPLFVEKKYGEISG